MPRQNRVLPTGEIVSARFRGGLMGNRGILHDEDGRLEAARWRHRNWVTCRLSFKGRHRPIMAPRRYTELFFFDEAVALAAGHRPCAECRRLDYERFRDAWVAAHGGPRPSAVEMDRALHAARLQPPGRNQRNFTARLRDLPDGVFIQAPDGVPHLIWAGRLHPYLGDRYGPRLSIRPAEISKVLTPAPSCRVLAAGYRPRAALPEA